MNLKTVNILELVRFRMMDGPSEYYLCEIWRGSQKRNYKLKKIKIDEQEVQAHRMKHI